LLAATDTSSIHGVCLCEREKLKEDKSSNLHLILH
jgi:hypothetical protein